MGFAGSNCVGELLWDRFRNGVRRSVGSECLTVSPVMLALDANAKFNMEYQSRMNHLRFSFVFAIALSILVADASAQEIDPRGIYFNRFEGQFDGTEWFQLVTTNGTTYTLRDIYGGGWSGQINEDGDIIINGFPPGMFTGPDNFVIFPSFAGGQFTFTCNRVPTTTPDFPLRLLSAHSNGTPLDGQWNNTLQFINPETGVKNPPANEVITITTGANTIRITDPQGLFFQGVFEHGLLAGFRVVANPSFPPAGGIFATFPGSATNIGQDLLGELNMININEFRASFLLQTRTQLGNQNQSLVEFRATRAVPVEMGDANADGVIDDLDELIVQAQQGRTFETAGYNLAADINNDGIINFADLAFYCTQGDMNQDGSVDLLDVSLFVVFVTNGIYFCEADINIDGSVDLLDVAPFVELLTGGG